MGVRVRQRPDKPGCWLFIDHQGKQKKKRFTDKETALKVARQVRERLALGDFSMTEEQPEAKAFSGYFETWLNGYGPTRLKSSTQELYWSTFTCHLKPFFGDTDLTKITREQVKRFLYEKVASGLSRDHVRNLLSALHACLNHAVEDGHILANPAARTSKLLYVRKEEKRSRIVFLTPEEEGRVLETCQEHLPAWYPFVLALLRLGVRIGEACALQWGDFDLEARSVEVRRNYVDGKMTTPKNGSSRRIDVSLHLAETLKALHVERKKETLRKGWGEVPPWVFVNAAGNPVDPDNFRRRLWAKILSTAELAYFPTHSLRHTFASRLIQNGATLLYVQHAMGHHSAAFTLQVYGHFQPTGNRSEVDKLDLLPAKGKNDAKKTG